MVQQAGLPIVRKVLISTNLEHPTHMLQRVPIKTHGSLTAMISNFRVMFHKLGYDSSLLNDSEILAFEDLVHNAEQTDEDFEYLKEVLNFMCDTKQASQEQDRATIERLAEIRHRLQAILDTQNDVLAVRDTEEEHIDADNLAALALEVTGHKDIAVVYKEIRKWYS